MKIHELRQNKLTIMVLTGNIGLGKTTFARTMVESGYAVASLDSISDSLMGGVTGTLHGARFARLCTVLYESTVYECLRSGVSVIADNLNLRVSERKFLCQMADEFGAVKLSVDFGCGTAEGLQRRVDQSNSFDYQGFDVMFQDLKNKYQKPSKEDGFDTVINKEAING